MVEQTTNIVRHHISEFFRGHDLTRPEIESFFDAVRKTTDENLLIELLTNWEDKGITEDELFYLARLMRSRMEPIRSDGDVFDIVGTGGSRAKTFNVSTAAAFVVAGAGVTVAKHGNRAATSNAGSSDVLEELGVNIDISRESSEQHLGHLGICFMFAPRFHSLSKTLAAARRKFGRPTIFNMLGPLCNPAGATHQLIGVWSRDRMDVIAAVLARLGTERSWIVHGTEGLDEISLGETFVTEVGNDKPWQSTITPADFGVEIVRGNVPVSLTAFESSRLISDILQNKRPGENTENLILMNSAAAIHLVGRSADLCEGFAIARDSLRSGNAYAKLTSLAEATK
jgi:anthranilate phosphoribosyltransferase